MTDAHAGVSIYRVYNFEHNAHWCALVNSGRAVRIDSGADEHGAYVLVTLVPLATFAGGQR